MQSAEQVLSQLPLTPKCWERIQIEFITYLGLAYYARGATKVDAAMDLDTEKCVYSEQYISSGSYLKFCW